MKRVYIVHGWAGNPTVNWFPWLKSELEKNDVAVTILSMPDSENPMPEIWLDYMNRSIVNPDENTFLVGHSLGGISILRYIEGLSDKTKLGGIILVASFTLPIGYIEPDRFCQTSVDFNKIKEIISNKSVIVNSDNDEYVPVSTADDLQRNIGGKFIMIHNGGHLTSRDGYEQFPMLFNEVLALIK